MTRFLTVIRAYLERDLAGRLAYRLSFLIYLFSAAIYFVAIFYVGKLVPPEVLAGADYFTVTAIGVGLYSFAATLVATPRTYLMGEIGSGSMETLLTLGPGPFTYVNATCANQGVRALGRTALVLALVAYFGVNVRAAALPLLAPVVIVTAAAALGLGYLQAAIDLQVRTAGRLVAMIGGAGTILSGVYFPSRLLPGPLQWLAQLLPATHAIEASRIALLEGRVPARPLLTLAGLAALYLGAGLLLLRAAFRRMLKDGSFLSY